MDRDMRESKKSRRKKKIEKEMEIEGGKMREKDALMENLGAWANVVHVACWCAYEGREMYVIQGLVRKDARGPHPSTMRAPVFASDP